MYPKLRSHFEKIVTLTDDEFEAVASYFSFKTLRKHQFLVQQGEAVQNDFWVVSGLLKAYYLAPNGKEHILQFAMEDWWITDYQAYFGKTSAQLNVNCLEDTQVLCLSLENREKICSNFQKIDTFFRKKANAGYVALQKRILSLLNDNPKERYTQFLTLYPTLLQRIPKTLIASYLGVSRETLSRLNQ
ncbi:Crp/Fnr family transcriptional regulator [Capnocytophaga sp.]|uniref:Crp/Fnr family transcriptional regulator n=1 Tax=Capnocytophaga sp. TaxID=44737 RepID=UPI0026DCE9EF|nr:Crp/Fnr family transcriptional regulator [Capnocytophaga sp.]MDO5106071.1 Crp/Fnr family transcriptional regulator [Capnocytophaga sp.]